MLIIFEDKLSYINGEGFELGVMKNEIIYQ